MKKLLIPLVCLIVLGAINLFPKSSDYDLYDKIIRLHILANSNSEEDQALKLKVRDGMLDIVSSVLENCSTKEEAEEVLKENIPLLQEAAEQTLRDNGSSYPVSLSIDQETYPEREYEGLRLPSGEYCSLRIMIGEAEGKNWWCVLFPPLCVGSASGVKEELISVGFTPDQIGILTDTESPKYRIRFKILDIIGSIFS